MSYMNQIINFTSGFYNCIIRYTSVYGTTSSYFYIIFKNNSSATWHFFIPDLPVCFGVIIKSIRSNYRSRLNNNMISDDAMIHYCNIWINNAIPSDRNMFSYINIWVNKTSLANTGRINQFGSRIKRTEI